MAIDPEQLVSELAREAHRRPSATPPAVLQHSAEPAPTLSPLRGSPAIRTVHDQWARIHAEEAGHGTPTGGTAGMRAKVRSRVVTAASEATRASQQEDRALIGDLIRAVDALAARSDEVSDRLHRLEVVLEELIAALGADLTQLRAALAPTPAAAATGRTDDEPGAVEEAPDVGG